MSLPNLLEDAAAPTRALAGITPFYVCGEEALESRVFNTATGVTLTIGVRFLLVTGEIVGFVFSHTPNTSGTVDRQRFPLPEGFILSATVNVSAGTPTGTACVCVLRVVRGLTANAIALGVLCQGALTAAQDLSWPLTTSGAGIAAAAAPATPAIRVGTNPGAGVEISETVPTGKIWQPVAMSFTLVTNATVANRFPRITLDDGANVYFSLSPFGALAASLTGLYSVGAGLLGIANAINDIAAGFPADLLMPAGHRIRTVTSGLQGADDFSAPIILAREWSA